MRNRQLVERINANLEPLGLRFEKVSPSRAIVLTRTGAKVPVRVRKDDVVSKLEAADADFGRAARDLDIVLH